MWLRYLKFLLNSQNQHGLHSPFVYELVTRCFYDTTKYSEYEILKDYRKELLEDKRKIEVTDFGAGSRVFKSKEREVGAIAKNVGIPKKRAKFLFRLAKYLDCQKILELGTSLGIGTTALALNKSAKVTSIEGCPQTAAVAKEKLQKFGLENVNLKVGEFGKVLGDIVESEKKVESGKWRVESEKEVESGEWRVESERKWKVESGEWRENNKQQTPNNKQQTDCEAVTGKPQTENSELTTHNREQQTTNHKQQKDCEAVAGKPPADNSELTTHDPPAPGLWRASREQQTKFDLIYFDGHHTKEATLKYFERLLPTAHNDSVFVFDDIHWSAGMEEAWEIIKKHSEVRVSIDTFHLGLIFFRKEQVKQDFIIRL